MTEEAQTNLIPPAPNDDGSSGESDEMVGKRPFCRGTGYVFQSIGFFLAMTTCCIWPAAHWWQDAPVVSAASADEMAGPKIESVLTMLGVVVAFLGGMGLITVGLGLQQDRFRTGRWAVAVTGFPMMYQWGYLIASLIYFPATGRIVIGSGLAILWTVLFILAGVSAEELRKNPPTQSELGWTSIDEDDLQKVLSLRSRDRKNR